jgi:hypothetical protein
MNCRKCNQPLLRRRKRRGFFQNVIFPFFGFYPWKCSLCESLGMYHARGEHQPKGKSADAHANDLGKA